MDITPDVDAPPQVRRPSLSRLQALGPLGVALVYPHLLNVSHTLKPFTLATSVGERLMGLAALLCALLVPVYGLVIAFGLGRLERPSAFERRARRLALLAVASPPLFVLCGVGLGLLGSPLPDVWAWTVGWCSALVFGSIASNRPAAVVATPRPALRVVHGVAAAVLVVFILFHLGNHLTGLLGPEAHAEVMRIGGVVYRSAAMEPILIALLLLQVAVGGGLAWRWTGNPGDFHRTVQIGSGVYVGAFILTHLNSALVSARLVRGIPTNWAWASGAPEGLLLDAWNIRLVPHYGYGVLFVFLHLCSGLRTVFLAHGMERRLANRIWTMGVAGGAVVAGTIMAALCGLRL